MERAARGSVAQTDPVPVEVSGSVTLTGEAYGVAGIEARRPATLGRAVANARFALFGLGTNLSLSLSTDEGARVRQDLDKVRLATRWSWGAAELGDVAPRLSAFVVAGVTPRGGMVEVRREVADVPVDVVAAGGRARRTVAVATAGGDAPGYDQWMWTGRARAGNPRATYAGVTLAVARDQAGSLDVELLDPLSRSRLGRPTASATVAPEAGLRLFDGGLTLRGLVATSAFAPDLDAPDGPDEVPSFLDPLLPTTTGAFAATAVEAALEGDLARLGVLPEYGLSLDADYRRVGPGYRTLAAPRLRNDEETVRLRPRGEFFDRRLSVDLDLARARTNLRGDDDVTGERLTLGTSVLARPTDWLTVSGAYVTLRNERASAPREDPAGFVDPRLLQTTQSLTLSPTAVLVGDNGTSHTASLAATVQTSRDCSDDVLDGTRPAADVDNWTTTAAYALALPSGLTVTAAADGSRSELGESRSVRTGLNVGAGQAFFDRTLSVSGSAGLSRSDAEYVSGAFTQTQLTASASATWRLPTGDPLRLQVTALRSASGSDDDLAPATPGFSEVRARVSFSRRF